MAAVVLLHGWGTTPAVFDELALRLFRRNDVRSPVLLTHEGSFSAARGLNAVAAEIASQAPSKCLVVGWSLGAQVALAWALAKPDQVERLVLLSATPAFVQRDDWQCAMAPALFEEFSDSLDDGAHRTLHRFITLQAQGDAEAKRVMRSLRAAQRGLRLATPDVLKAGLRLLRDTDLRSVLPRIATRALVVHGARDQLVPIAAAEYLAKALPLATLALLPGSAHAPFVSNPDGVECLIQAFFDER